MKIFLRNKFWRAAVIFGGLLALPSLTLAQAQTTGFQGGLNNLSGLFPNTGGISGATTLTGPSGLAYLVINILLLVAGLISVVFVIIGGYQYMTSAGNEEQAEKGKQNVINAIIGVVIIILSYVIINVVYNLITSNG